MGIYELLQLTDEDWATESAKFPRDYGGYWPGTDGYLRVGIGQSRDSDNLEKSNWVAAVKILQEAAAELGEQDEPENGWVYEHGASHWAVGWVDSLWIAPHPALMSEVRSLWGALTSYPVLDESDYSERELEDWLQYTSDEVHFAAGQLNVVADETLVTQVQEILGQTSNCVEDVDPDHLRELVERFGKVEV